MSLYPLVHTILVPQGAEYQAVCRGLRTVPVSIQPTVLPIPVGTLALSRQLQVWQDMPHFNHGQRILMMGLCGAMLPQHPVGEAVLYQKCVYRSDKPPTIRSCDRPLTAQLQENFPTLPLVQGLTSDRLVCSAQEKYDLAQQYGTDVVDMESFIALQFLQQRGVAVAVLRVVSDRSLDDIPDLTPAIDTEGVIQPLPLALGMLRQPIAAFHLIQGALQGLQTLRTLVSHAFK